MYEIIHDWKFSDLLQWEVEQLLEVGQVCWGKVLP